jgi:hypothetical protein
MGLAPKGAIPSLKAAARAALRRVLFPDWPAIAPTACPRPPARPVRSWQAPRRLGITTKAPTRRVIRNPRCFVEEHGVHALVDLVHEHDLGERARRIGTSSPLPDQLARRSAKHLPT